jgi:hypothetical protein
MSTNIQNNSKSNAVRQMDNPNQCPIFSGSSGNEFLVFNETWRANMRLNNVEDIIINGLHQGVKLREGCRLPAPDRFKTVCQIQKQQIEAEAKERSTVYAAITQECPWIVYWWKNVPIPVGFPSGQDPITKEMRDFEEVTLDECHALLEHLPLGCDDILDSMYGYPAHHVRSPGIVYSRHPLSQKYYPNVFAGAPLVSYDDNAKYLGTHIAAEFVLAMKNCFAESKFLNYETLKLTLGEGPPPMRTCQDYENDLDATTQNLIEKTYQANLNCFKAQDVELNNLHKTSMLVFSKIGSSSLMLVTEELRTNNFHAAYRKIEKYFIDKGVSNIESFEQAVVNVILQPGKDFSTHWLLLQDALKRLAMVSGVQRDGLYHPAIIGMIVPVPKINLLEAIANSGELSDQEIETVYGRVLIPETRRIQILETSVTTGITRFAKAKEDMYELPVEQRTIRTFLEKLNRRETSKPGQEHKENEVKSSNRLTKDESSNSKTAMTAKENPSSGKYPKGTCPNHPDSTTHTLAECKFKKASNGSSNSNPKNEKQSSDNKNPTQKRKWIEKFCTYCDKNNWKNRESHDTSECTLKNKRNNSSSRANITQSNNDEENDSDDTTTRKSKKSRRKSANASRAMDSSNAIQSSGSIDADRLQFILSNWNQVNKYIDEEENGSSSSSSRRN